MTEIEPRPQRWEAKGYLKNNHILKYLLEYELWHFQKVCMNPCSMCAPNDLNTYPMFDFKARF